MKENTNLLYQHFATRTIKFLQSYPLKHFPNILDADVLHANAFEYLRLHIKNSITHFHLISFICRSKTSNMSLPLSLSPPQSVVALHLTFCCCKNSYIPISVRSSPHLFFRSFIQAFPFSTRKDVILIFNNHLAYFVV